MKDNPYAAGRKAKGKRNPAAAQEVQQWMAQKNRRANRLRMLIFYIIIPALVLLALLVRLL